jgi:branched-chain amino acid transport system permease protein
MADIASFLVVGILAGSLYALVAVGLNLVFGVMRFINVAHGDMVTVGAYAAIALSFVIDPGLAGSLAAAVVVGLALGAVIHRSLIRAITQRGTVDERRGLVLTVGLSFLMANLILLAFGADYRPGPGGLQTAPLRMGQVVLQGSRLVALAGSLLLSALLLGFLRFTRTGLAVRATAQNPDAALASGIDIRRVQTLSFSISSALAAAAGALIAPFIFSFPAMGFPMVIKAFIVVIIGGLGSVWGALLAGYGLGVVEALSVLWLPSGFNELMGPLTMLLVLLLRPEGLLGRRVQRA